MEFKIIDNALIFIYHYSEYNNGDWVRSNLQEVDSVVFKRILYFIPEDVYETEIEYDEFDAPFPPVAFLFAELKNDYYQIKRHIIRTENNFFFHKDLDIQLKFIIAETKISILKQIDELVKEDIYIGGEVESNIPIEVFIKMINEFPTTYEKKLYAQARVSSIIKNYFDTTVDSELKFQKYLNNKNSKQGKRLMKLFKEYELQKFRTIQEKLRGMLESENDYSEDQWQNEILEIVLLLYPKYICSFKTVHVKINEQKRRFLDFMLVDSNGNIDVIEIKKPFENVIMTNSLYRGNYTPHKDLVGTIMQLEKYLFHLNRYGESGEKKLTEKYKEKLPEGLKIKITNPKGFVIMGRETNLSDEQRDDFEIVKRKYKNVIDIITYDDLLQRLDFTIEQIQKM
ncbi:hypothetical protein AS589_07985 [Empedobacter brevis]|uniref:Shedu immune nuclease family protein n=1 Tax=Empedobacter brevis TaxID=247 RepID=UPI00131F69EC|nr:Shedu immune nuclease family protein [Empedobacter brevis]QHC84727.1 hypothetical protein AS589_07985 [Empedobacter brevis]